MNIKSDSRPGNRSVDEIEGLHRDIRRELGDGYSDRDVARRLGITDRTVFRYRKRHGIANYRERTGL